MSKLASPAIFLVTSGRARSEDDEGWRKALRSASTAAAAGIDVVQVREPELPDQPLAALVRSVVAEVSGSPTVVVVNDRPDVALSCRADGVHLRADGLSAARVRTLLPRDALIGRSVHSRVEARESAIEGAVDYLFFGTVFRSGNKAAAHPVQGPAALQAVCQSVSLPVIAIGGVTIDNVGEIAAAGAAGVAAIGLFAERTDARADLEALVRQLREAFI